MKEGVKVSILMPVRNAMPFLKECLDSILGQTFQQWELLAVNDHSTDGSEKILQEFQDRDSRIQFFNSEGKGIIPALRTAYKNANGNFITRMDADDVMHTNKLAWMFEQLSESGPGHLVVGLVKYISEQKLGEGYLKYENWLNELSLQERNFDEIYKECVVPSPCWMIHKSDLEKVGHFSFDVYPEDYDLCFRFRNNGLKIKSVKKKIHYWRDHPNRSSRIDPNYSDNRFLELKMNHFIEYDFRPNEKLFLWGAGKKGKAIAQILQKRKINFRWFTNNVKKIGHSIYDIQLENESLLDDLNADCLIVAIAERGLKEDFDSDRKRKTGFDKENVYFFC